MPTPDDVLPFVPLLLAMVPPVPLPPSEVLVPSPFTVKLPLVLFREMPSLVPPEDETLVRAIANGVVPLVLLMLIAVPEPALIVPLVVVIVFVFSVAFNPVWFEVVLVILSAAKAIVPVLPVRLTAAAPEFVTLVVPVTEKEPAVVSMVIPVVLLFVEDRLCRMTSAVPLLRFSARPEPLLMVVSLIFSCVP